MRTLAQIIITQISTSSYRKEKLFFYLFRPLKAGVFGFSVIMIILFLGNLFCSILGIKNLALNKIDLFLAGFCFLLKAVENLLKNFHD